MIRTLSHGLFLGALLLGTAGHADQPKAAADMRAFTREVAAAFQRGDLDAVFSRFDERMSAALPKAKLAEFNSTLTFQVGKLQSVGEPKVSESDGMQRSETPLTFERATLNMKLSMKDGKIAALFFLPVEKPAEPWSAPAYAKADAFKETEVTVNAGTEWALPGTLSMPGGPGPFPAVVLVHGSGPHDRDETIGPNKPFRDLAWGLASRGVAVLRYVKRTKVHAEKVMRSGSFTVKDETVADAAAGVRLLRGTAGIDPKRVFVAGHSLGGMLAPRVGKDEPGTAGLIILAGTTRPLEKVVLEQADYLEKLGGGASNPMLAELRKQALLIPSVDAKTPGLIMGAPASYWLDLRGYQPPKVSAELKKPILVLQGERDYQVTMADFAGWKTGLAGSKSVEFRTYPKLNHLFMEGEGPSTPQEYERAGHVAVGVVDDIAAWVNGSGAR